MAFITSTFDFFFKRLGPTGSISGYTGYLPENWMSASSTSPRVSSSFLNFPDDTSTLTYTTTRDSASNATYRALAWGSHACDFLWNCTVPSWSYQDIVYSPGGIYQFTYRVWSMLLNSSESFHKKYKGSTFGVDSYAVTSSWHMVDPKNITASYTYPTANKFAYETDVSHVGSTYPTFVGSRRPNGTAGTSDESNYFAYDVTFPNTTGSNATSSLDNTYFDYGGGVGITRALVSASLVIAKISGSDDTVTGLKDMTQALKSRRLFFPTPYSGSAPNYHYEDYWFKQFTGYQASTLFQDNGGIYNVQFTLKRSLVNGYYPDTNTVMKVFIHDVASPIPSSSARIQGASGWYPPDNNIVIIGNGYNGGPIMTFYDTQTGLAIERFNINVIQYGYPAQLCFEASGSLDNDSYFGVVLDDIKVCKIGVTTDPRFIKPLTPGAQGTTGGTGGVVPIGPPGPPPSN